MDVIVGSSTGVVKGIRLADDTTRNLNFSHNLDKTNEPVALCWHQNASSSKNECQTEFLCAMMNRKVKLFDLNDEQKSKEVFECGEGSGRIRGLDCINGDIITCVESGEIRLRSTNGEDKKVDLNVGANVCRMRRDTNKPNLIATGGKENALKVWDLNAQDISKPVFASKNVRHDWLELRVPVWDTDLRFLENDDLLVTCTGNHLVRLYDRKVNCRRPVVQIDWTDHPFTTLSSNNHDRQVIVGSTRGFMGAFDLRSPGKLLHVYKGFAGSISAVEAHPTLPYVASCSLDRFVRVHHVDTRKMLHKVYCKSPLSAMLLSNHLSIDPLSTASRIVKQEEESGDERSASPDFRPMGDEQQDADSLWTSMAQVGRAKSNHPKRRKRIKEEPIDSAEEAESLPSGKKSKQRMSFPHSDELQQHAEHKAVLRKKKKIKEMTEE